MENAEASLRHNTFDAAPVKKRKTKPPLTIPVNGGMVF
jgi:hypothetical protein